jgi:hypothetical protein
MAIANQSDSNSILEAARLFIAVALVLIGLYLATFGNSWAPIVLELLPASELGAWLELIVPFLPMVRRVAGRTPRITNSPGANLSQLAKRFEPVRAEHMDVRAKSSHPDQDQ